MAAETETAARKTVTIVFCDVTDSTALGELLDPESVRSVMGRWFEAMREVLLAHGGTVEKFVGDAVMAVFGVPTLHEDDALRAARAAAGMRDALARLNGELAHPLQIRIGVNTGEVVAGDPSTGQTFVTGDAVNVAKRLEQAAQPGEILIGTPTKRLVENAVRTEPRGAVAAKGKKDAVEAWALVDVSADAPPFARRLDVRLVGRDAELERLRAELAQADAARGCRLVTLLGPAGIGKSRLAAELAARSPHAQIMTARCLPYGDGLTFWPLAHAIRNVGGLGFAEQALAGEPDAELVLERVRGAIETTETAAAVEETFWGVRRLLEALARERPLVVCIEDVHWAEPTFLDLVEYVARWSRDAPILLLCLARPELLDERPAWSGLGTPIPLEPLSGDAADLLLDELAAEWPLSPAVRARVREAAEGNPLFVEQMVAMLTEEDGTENVAVPPTIQALLAARLDRLESDERRMLERAAVLGRDFTRGGVSALSPEGERDRVGSALLALTRKELVQPGATTLRGDDGFRFRHALIRDAAYAGVSKERRATLHEHAAAWLEQAGAGDELVGYHLEQAYRFRAVLGERARPLAQRAAELLGRCGRRAYLREDMAAASSLLGRALELGDADDPARLELQRELSGALWWHGESTRATEVLEQLVTEARAQGDRSQEWYALVELSARRQADGRGVSSAEILRVCEEAIAVFEELDDETGLARAWRRIAYAHLLEGRFGPTGEAAARALAHARAAREPHEESRIVDALCTGLLYGPAPAAGAIERCRTLLEQGRDSRVMEANVQTSLAGLLAMVGEVEEARALTARAAATFEDLGLRLALAGLTQVAGPMELLVGDPAAAARHLERGLQLLEGIGPFDFHVALLAETMYRSGSFDAAALLVERAEREPSGDLVAQAILLGTTAKLRAREGEAASALARGAAALAERTDDLNLQADALVNLAEVLGREQREPERRAALEQAVERYEQKGNAVAAARVCELLGERVV